MRVRILFICLIIVSTTLFGCKKSKQNKLTGSWELLPQTAAQQNNTIIYTFGSDNKLYVTTDTIVDTADYELKSDFTKYYVVIRNLDAAVDANYYIEKLNRKILVLQCQSPYMRKEFTRHEE
jgi:hypothetical protein